MYDHPGLVTLWLLSARLCARSVVWGPVSPVQEAHSWVSCTDDTTFTSMMTGSLLRKHQTSQIGSLLCCVWFILYERSAVRKQVAG